jgi:ABC-type thiamine transport system substrate-binding protein
VFSLQASAATQLTVYTALEAEQLKSYKQAFEKANPDIEIKWVRDSTGIITAKLLAEKDRPQADAVWGLAASSLAILDQNGMLEAYAPEGPGQDRRQLPRRRQPAGLGRHGRVGRDHLLQHRRSREAGPEQAGELAGPDQA